MSTSPTPFLSIPLPVPGSGEPFTVAAYNNAITALDAEHQSADAAITSLQSRATTLEGYDAARPGTGGVADYKAASLAALDGISTAEVGDRALVTSPGTGIDPITLVATSGSGSTIEWTIQGMVVASTKANLDSFVTAVGALSGTDVLFQVGGLAHVTATHVTYRWTSTAGAYRHAYAMNEIVPSSGDVSVGSGSVTVDANGVVSFTGASTVSVDNCFSSEFRNYRITWQLTAIAADNNLGCRVRAGGVTLSTAGQYAGVRSESNAGGAFANSTETNTRLGVGRGSAAGLGSGEFTLRSPFQNTRTWLGGPDGSFDGTFTRSQWGAVINTNSYDGFQLMNDVGSTMSGTLSIQGYD